MAKEKVAKKEMNLADTLADLNKRYGNGSVGRYADMPVQDIETVSSGSIALDKALGVGGYPRGRIVEIYGPYSSGKSTVALHAVAEMQKIGGTCAYIDAEHALDMGYAAKLGVDTGTLLLSQPNSAEEGLEIVENLTRTKEVALIVIDSVAALVPKAELEGEMGDSHVGLQARLMGQALRKLVALTHETNTLIFFINQTRLKIGVMFGNPTTTSGGEALKFYTSVRMEIARTGAIKEGDEAVGNATRVKVVKNKVAPPFQEAEFSIMYGKGIDKTQEILDASVALKNVEKSGSWYSYAGERMGQGSDGACSWLNINPEVKDKLEALIRKEWKL